jgi:tetratricopeptide (TPR) repeat protein
MSQPDPDSVERAPAGPPAAAQAPQEFDLLAFWIQHRRLIIRIVVLAFIGVAVWGTFEFFRFRKRIASEQALATAKSADDFRRVTTDWAGTAAGGTAWLRLADELRKAGKPAESAQALRSFLEKYPLHPLRTAASHELAASLETAGKLDEALSDYQRLAAAGGKGAFAPLALLGQARVLLEQGKREEARKALETLEQQYPNSPFFAEANRWLDEIKNPAGTKTGGSPRPTPTPAPAPAPATPGAVPGAPGTPAPAAQPPKSAPPATPPGSSTPATPQPPPASPPPQPRPAAPSPATLPAGSTPPPAPPVPAPGQPPK